MRVGIVARGMATDLRGSCFVPSSQDSQKSSSSLSAGEGSNVYDLYGVSNHIGEVTSLRWHGLT